MLKGRRRIRGALRLATTAGVAAALAVGTLLATAGPASADPSSNAWYRLRMCESSDNYSINTGNGYYGAYQFDLPTWRSVGGTGYPNQASPAEQDYRALYLYRMRGWQPWTCARILGLSEDSDARSRVVPARPGSGSTTPPAPSSSTPAWPGVVYSYGDYSSNLRTYQLELKKRGLPFDGTAYFGDKTRQYTEQLQRANGLPVTGKIDKATWNAAWSGKLTGSSGSSSGGSTPASSAPAWPGVQYSYGDYSDNLRTWQLQMKKRGLPFDGTGYFGDKTLKYVKQLQKDNGLNVVGFIGPKTWAAAWTGTV